MLEMGGIVKRFPGVVASDGVDFDVRAGEVHTLLGENGAGKSTLMKILYGLYQADEGEIRIHGDVADITSPTDAIGLGVGMIHQHFMLVDTLTVAENVALGLRSERGILTDLDRVSERIGELSERYGLQIDPEALIWQLAVGQRQRVEIIKALYRDAKLLILDEPTAVLTPQEVDQLFVTLRQMTADGRGLIFISHKLHEVLALSDRITVLRHGKVTGHLQAEDATREVLAEMMVGRQVQMVPDKPSVAATEPVLQIRNLTVMGDRGDEAVRALDLEVRAGEILGVAGVSGNGQRELAQAIAGLRPVESGTVQIGDSDVTNLRPAQVRAEGLAYVPEERMHTGAIAGFSVTENLLLIDHGNERFVSRGLLDFEAIRRHCQGLVDEYDVKTPSLETPAQSLSGGNIQKLILARELSGTPKVLIAAQPTRGVDIGASEYIHRRLIEQRSESTAVLMVSEDLDEVFALSDRIAVIYEGQIIGVVDAASTTRQAIGLMMAGVTE
jgi:simple sugar transport system ATP-binding protein